MNTLIIGPAWVGDMVMAQSLFILLNQRYPDVPIDVVAPAWSAGLLERMPQVRRTVSLNVSHGQLGLGERRRVGNSLRNNYERAIVLPTTWKSALVPWFARIPVRTGFLGEMRYGLLTDIRDLDKSVLSMTVHRYLALGQDKPEPLPPAHIPQPHLVSSHEQQDLLCEKYTLDTTRPACVLFPGAEYGPAKQWPIEYFAELAARLTEDGKQVWVIGSAKDHEAGERICAAKEFAFNLCGKTSLSEAIDAVAMAKVAITNDSGLMHVAAALDVPVVALYGSSSPEKTPPLTDKKVILRQELDCAPCFERSCPLGHTDCLRSISVDTVWEQVGLISDVILRAKV
ncbi:lipopolysaccharide heptosyltransferase II [Desulfurispira natronophila]|uniref:lipopolysaccharide heptosyltransferase II n=1 Tax=Desulfurispira natronophila TaxID=682562 RepID=A0A7W7Y4I7_9BACT|nr:heptosyltransferase-2 [Desulfurispira natronophila]